MRDFNFFLPYLNDKKERKNKKVYIVTTLLILGLIVLGSLTYNSVYIFMLNNNIKDLKATFETADNQEKLAQAEKLNKTFDILNSYDKEMETVFSDIQGRNAVNSSILFDISNSIPKEVSFRTMSINTDVIQIQGVSTSRVAIAELEYNLKALDSMAEVHVGNINLEGNEAEGLYSFSIKCTLKGGDDDEAK